MEIIFNVWKVKNPSKATIRHHYYFETKISGILGGPELKGIAQAINILIVKKRGVDFICRISTTAKQSLLWIPYEKCFVACEDLSQQEAEELIKLLNSEARK